MKKLREILFISAILGILCVLYSCSDGGHSHEYSSTVVQADCYNDGYIEYKCSCGESYKDDYVPKSHSFTSQSTIQQLTCLQDGIIKKICDCGYETEETIATQGHKYVSDKTDATCTEDGLEVITCENCSDYKVEIVIPASHELNGDLCTECGRTIWDGISDTSWYNEDQSSFIITNSAQLSGLAELVNSGIDFSSKTVKLGADIDLGDKVWTPIGSWDTPFNGTFNGDGYKITNFVFNSFDASYCGLFGFNGGTIKNLIVDECVVKINATSLPASGDLDYNLGAIAGYNKGVISACTADVNINITIKGNYNNQAYICVGGLVGYSLSDSLINENCSSSGNIIVNATSVDTIQLFIGGAIGVAYTESNAINSSSSVDINVYNFSTSNGDIKVYLGGFVGSTQGRNYNCSATGNVESEQKIYAGRLYENYIGGFAGYIGSEEETALCSASGNVKFTTQASDSTNHLEIGGFAGHIASATSKCYSLGSIIVDAGDATHSIAGGFVGKLINSIDQCYAKGNVNNVSIGEAISGGFVGYSYYGTISNCYCTGAVEHKTSGSSTYSSTYAGGFVGIIIGSISNCYATSNTRVISSNGTSAKAGSLIGLASYGSTVSACFASGDVFVRETSGNNSGNVAGALLAHSDGVYPTSCYYNTAMDLTSSGGAVMKYGNALGVGSFMTYSFAKNTLKWSTDIWNMADDVLPTLAFE